MVGVCVRCSVTSAANSRTFRRMKKQKLLVASFNYEEKAGIWTASMQRKYLRAQKSVFGYLKIVSMSVAFFFFFFVPA